ncbi:hypothetical protein AS593_17190 [Caulobacter vibrioides]|nr:hypothetical protein AS593_17190 [Caulobacter vibrioides]
MAAPTKPAIKIVGEVTISFGPDGSMVVKTGEGAVTTFGDAALEAAPVAAKPTALKSSSVGKPLAAPAKDAPIATALPSSGVVKTSALALATGGGGGADAAAGGGAGDDAQKVTEETTVETTKEVSVDNAPKEITVTKETTKVTTLDKKKVVADLYAGTGALISGNLGSRRADAIKFISRPDGEIFAQVQKAEDVDIQIAVETHYLLQNQSLFEGDSATAGLAGIWDGLGKLAACGPFAFANDASGQVVGCGPLFTAVLDSDAKIDQFGIGWALGLGKKAGSPDRADFGLGIGVLFDTDSKVVDHRIIDKDSMLVLPQYRDLIKNDTANAISPLVTRASASAFVMVSKTF